MSAEGCGYPTPFAGDYLTCGTQLVGRFPSVPVLCVPCQTARHAPRTHDVAPGATCEGCREAPATRTRAPLLCDACEAEYATDLDQRDDPGEPGSSCTTQCGFCGRCGGA